MHNMKRVIRNRALVGMLSAFLLMSGTSYSSVSVYAADGSNGKFIGLDHVVALGDNGETVTAYYR
ncbi:hypothetical protein [Butyrivibrio fibrisolvens]|uniref:Uncharacterized protein n=1 Tax=Butyrivibrio fibrisolvens TaxID=831 RepID=A0A317G326_BUTFI|nr:hypothetical protein [Butyrivibrio fibrisolvens]PWT26810.1 hypothetical protein CPT75_06670 [Butyrivibrio fibrisolvens]